jgi:hypothetical protein
MWSDGGTDNPHTVNAAGDYTVTQTVNGCTSQASIAVTAAPKTGISAPIVGSITQPTCAIPTGSVALSGLPSGAWTLTRNPGGVNTNGSGSTTIVNNLAAGITYTFTVTSGSCTSGSSANVVINAAPTSPTVSSIIGPSSVCVGNTIQLTDATSGGVWSSSNNTRATVNSNGVVTGIRSGNVTITYRITNSCGTIATSKFITVNSVLTARIFYFGSPYCQDEGTATVIRIGQSGGTYSSTAGLVINSNTGSINLGASTPGTYIVTYTFSNGNCTDTTTATITILASPTATISYAGSPYCQNGTATVTRTGQAGGRYSSSRGLSINRNTGAIDLHNSRPGTYIVTYSFSNGNCSNTASTSVRIENCRGNNSNNSNNNQYGNKQAVIEIDNLQAIAYPNPTQNYFNLKINSNSTDNVQIKVFDMAGKLLTVMNGSVGEIYRFGQQYTSGTYVVEVRQGDQRVTTKVVKQ